MAEIEAEAEANKARPLCQCSDEEVSLKTYNINTTQQNHLTAIFQAHLSYMQVPFQALMLLVSQHKGILPI